MAKKVIFWNIKSKPRDKKYQHEEGLGCYKLSTLAKQQGYETVVYQDHSFEADPDKINDVTLLNLSRDQNIIAYSLLSNGVSLLEEMVNCGIPKRVPVLLGGPGASIEPEKVLRIFKGHRAPVALVQGEAEPVFERILQTPPVIWYTIPRIWSFSQSGDIVHGNYLTLDNLDLSPFADLSASYQRRESESESKKEDLPLRQRLELLKSLTISQIESRRGCVHRCGFCNQSCLPTKGIRASSPKRLILEMEHMFDEYGITFFSLADNVAFDNTSWWREFTALMKSSPITQYIQFGGYSTPKVFNNQRWLNQIMPELYGVGLRGIILGVQAGSGSILKDIIHRPQTDPKDALEITKAAVSLGINLKCDFIIGHPTETLQDLQETHYWMNQIYQAGGEVFVRRLGIVPHSEYALKLERGEYTLPEQTEKVQEESTAILAMDGIDDVYRRIAFSNHRIPNKYLIDRNLGIVYPSTLFDLTTLKQNQARLTQSEMPEHIKDRYQRMFELAIELKRKSSRNYELI